MNPAAWYRWRADQLLLDCRLKPRGRANRVLGLRQGRLQVQVKAPPVDGKANAALCSLLATEFQLPRQHAELVSGARGPNKTVALHQPAVLPDWFSELSQSPA
ncbi:uncharacterized protein (TIGR00251 family) [Methylohalomonas lacus]|uniref:UPF0235 protein J2T55_001286 n=1 Tax=Methylohalomonas lacus TaxID=398773 RepID=A0AAE3L1J9_9GAMM|nr:DUF167 domain-containing protein [Methylohalomonas lacus]MCS3903266.1 uncharacterized protein (TIGR00251 family) [Methylohalomonas lacus]